MVYDYLFLGIKVEHYLYVIYTFLQNKFKKLIIKTIEKNRKRCMRNLYFILEYDAKIDDTKIGIYSLNYKRLKIPRILDVARYVSLSPLRRRRTNLPVSLHPTLRPISIIYII